MNNFQSTKFVDYPSINVSTHHMTIITRPIRPLSWNITFPRIVNDYNE